MRCQIMTYNIHGLPWSKNNSADIVAWIRTVKPSILCLQEVFTESSRAFYKEQLSRIGYTVVIPRDTQVTLLPSGLLTAFLDYEYTYVSDCFCPYMTYYNIEIFANKGYHATCLRQKLSGETLTVLNTHTQSNTEISWLFGSKKVVESQKSQFEQMCKYVERLNHPAILVGDLNSEHSPHPHVRFLHIPLMKKHTFPTTGEDLDHVAWFPLQYARNGCQFCNIDRKGPSLESCEVIDIHLSDHCPLLATVQIPKLMRGENTA
ncbi:MAG: hypothetical protein EBT07_08375 [Actinobacteria bacterium]|nr:hypothetical protein [Actinomycetota bacterium]